MTDFDDMDDLDLEDFEGFDYPDDEDDDDSPFGPRRCGICGAELIFAGASEATDDVYFVCPNEGQEDHRAQS